ncbi:MAG: hypothetical protein HC910_11500 [Spirulinaceae cyanobacterium SM2_1_0]|nr:hypothetical protein [Spirulinaceae cyanobacterium SM2_1_0]
MVNLGYRAARLKGKLGRAFYAHRLAHQGRISGNPPPLIASVYSLSCQRDLPEQVANIRLLLTHVGLPQQFVVVSDGSYTADSIQLLQRLHPCVRVIPLVDFVRPDLPAAVFHYAEISPMGKKLAMLLSIPVTQPSLYTDSDIFFFPAAGDLAALLERADGQNYYLTDTYQSFDWRILQSEAEAATPINGGFILLKQALDWQIAMQRFLALTEPPNYFTEQTMVHLTLHANGAQPLDRQRYIMELDDEFVYGDRYARRPDIVLRHYVNPVRHKFWGNWSHLYLGSRSRRRTA